MAYIKEYWQDKQKRMKLAQRHTEEMEKIFEDEIRESVMHTRIYDAEMIGQIPDPDKTEICVCDADSVSAIFKFFRGKTAVLNFASYKEPGGMFLEGSKAQEECLCHASNLYNVLRQFRENYYSWNNVHKNRSLYLNRAIYTPGIRFMSEGKTTSCDVITCAAPNKSAAQKYCHVTDEENSRVLESRIRFILEIAGAQGVRTLILGAYGCGVFGQEPGEVARVFKKYLKTMHWSFKNVVFAIPKGDNQNFETFRQVFHSSIGMQQKSDG